MLKSSTVARSSASPYCERAIQFWLVLPRSDGWMVMLGLVPTAVPFTYSVPTLPFTTIATCDHWFSGSVPVPLITCSAAPPPPVVMAKRIAEPALTVRNMYRVVPVPKSKMRDQVVFACGFTQVDTVQLPFSVPVTLLGSVTHSPLPPSLSALPILPSARGPVAAPPGVLIGSLAHRFMTPVLIWSAIPLISVALASSPSIWYSSAAALAPEYQNEVSVRSCGRVPYCWNATESASLPGSVPAEYSIVPLWLVSNFASVPLTSHSEYFARFLRIDFGPPWTL